MVKGTCYPLMGKFLSRDHWYSIKDSTVPILLLGGPDLAFESTFPYLSVITALVIGLHCIIAMALVSALRFVLELIQ